MQEELRKLEKERKWVMLSSLSIYFLLVMNMFLFFIMYILDLVYVGVATTIGTLLTILLTQLFLFSKKEIQYKEHYKRLFVEDAVKNVFEDACYGPREQLPKEKIANTEMMSMGSSYYSNDYIQGRYKGVLFEQADVCIQNGSGKSTTTYFKGRWMIFEFPKPFASEVQIKEKGFSYAKKTGKRSGKRPKMQTIKAGDAQFDKKFQVNAVDEREALSLLTSRTMENIMWLEKQNKGKLMICFVDNQLHIALHNKKDAFEPPVYRKINPERALRAVEKEIDMIIRFIEAFL